MRRQGRSGDEQKDALSRNARMTLSVAPTGGPLGSLEINKHRRVD